MHSRLAVASLASAVATNPDSVSICKIINSEREKTNREKEEVERKRESGCWTEKEGMLSQIDRQSIMERIIVRGTNLEILSSSDLVIRTSMMQSDNESMSVSVNRNDGR